MVVSNSLNMELIDYSVTLDVPSSDPSNLDGGTGSFSLTTTDKGQPQRRKNKQVTLTDDIVGTVLGRISSVSIDSGTATHTAETMLNRLTAEITIYPQRVALNTGMDVILAKVGMSAEGLPSAVTSFPGWSGSLLDYLKHFCVAEDQEFVPHSTNPDRVVFRSIRGVTHDFPYATYSLSTDSQSLARSIDITNYGYGALTSWPSVIEFTPSQVDDMQILTVDSGEVATYDIRLNAWAATVSQPAVYDLIGPEVRTDGGAYCVSGADGLPITAAQWVALGGSVKVEISEDPSILRVTVIAPDALSIMGPDGDEHLAPYNIAATSGDGTYYNSLHITGYGVAFTKEVLTLPTGVPLSMNAQDSKITVDNPWVGDRNKAFGLGVRAAQNYAGAGYNVQGSTNPRMSTANMVGGRLLGDDIMLRIVSVTSSSGEQSFRGIADTTIADFNAAMGSKTFAQLNAILGSMTFDEWSTVPLKDEADA